MVQLKNDFSSFFATTKNLAVTASNLGQAQVVTGPLVMLKQYFWRRIKKGATFFRVLCVLLSSDVIIPFGLK
jgi:hypothetical protein